MTGVDQLTFTTHPTEDGKWIGRVAEFPSLRTRALVSRMDAISQIIALAEKRLAHINTGGSTK